MFLIPVSIVTFCNVWFGRFFEAREMIQLPANPGSFGKTGDRGEPDSFRGVSGYTLCRHVAEKLVPDCRFLPDFFRGTGPFYEVKFIMREGRNHEGLWWWQGDFATSILLRPPEIKATAGSSVVRNRESRRGLRPPSILATR